MKCPARFTDRTRVKERKPLHSLLEFRRHVQCLAPIHSMALRALFFCVLFVLLSCCCCCCNAPLLLYVFISRASLITRVLQFCKEALFSHQLQSIISIHTAYNTNTIHTHTVRLDEFVSSPLVCLIPFQSWINQCSVPFIHSIQIHMFPLCWVHIPKLYVMRAPFQAKHTQSTERLHTHTHSHSQIRQTNHYLTLYALWVLFVVELSRFPSFIRRTCVLVYVCLCEWARQLHAKKKSILRSVFAVSPSIHKHSQIDRTIWFPIPFGFDSLMFSVLNVFFALQIRRYYWFLGDHSRDSLEKVFANCCIKMFGIFMRE